MPNIKSAKKRVLTTKKETELNRFLGTTVLIQFIVTLITNFLIGYIFLM